MENDLKGNENYFELTGGSSYRELTVFCARRKKFLSWGRGAVLLYKFQWMCAVRVLNSDLKTLRQSKTDTLFKGD